MSELTYEQKVKLAGLAMAQLDELAGMVSSFDPVVGQALLTFGILTRGGRGDLILSFTESVKPVVAKIIEAAFQEVEMEGAKKVD